MRIAQARRGQTVPNLLKNGSTDRAAEELTTRAHRARRRLPNLGTRIQALRTGGERNGDSLLRLHGEQKQPTEALVHQRRHCAKLEANDTIFRIVRFVSR